MRVLFVSTSSGSRGGGELFLLLLGEGLRQLGHEVGLVANTHPRMDELAASFAPLGPVFRVPFRNTYDYRWRSLAHLWPGSPGSAFAQAIRDWQPHVVHLNKQTNEDGLDLVRTLANRSRPWLATIHITQSCRQLGMRQAWLRDALARLFLQQAGVPLVAVSVRRADDLRRFLGSSQSLVRAVPNGVHLPDRADQAARRSAGRAQLGLAPETVLALCVGRLEEQKDPLSIVPLLQQARQAGRPLQLAWVGDGSSRPRWEQAVQEAGLGDAVRCLGWQTDVTPYLAAADVFFHPAKFEGLPLALLEAMAWRLPCWVWSSLQEDLEAPLRPVVQTLDDPGWLGQVLAPGRRQEIGERARAIIERHYSVLAMARAYQRLYAEVQA